MPIKTLRVEVTGGPDAGKVFVATSDTVTVGSAPGNDVVLADDTVSRHHLELVRRGDRISVADLGSTNGTLLAGALLERAQVAPGATLALGKTRLLVTDGEPHEVELLDEDRLGPLRGRSSAMRTVMARIARAARSDASVLILGETGTGKEVIARALHEESRRATGPFETVDCGALIPTLVASELFGHEKGAFTGADQQHVGAFERAHGGTLFLDEIGEIPAALQATLLGALERRSFKRLGGTKPIAVDVRLVSATHRDLRSDVNAGSFRQDLYYRLAVVTLHVPPLRERPGDIPLLVEHFLRLAGFDGAVDEVVPARAMDGLLAHRWPGNVRELRNFVEAALAMGEPPQLDEGARARGRSIAAGGPDPSLTPYSEARSAVLQDFEHRYLTALLARTRSNVSAAAREAKMNRQHLIEMLKRHGLK